MRALVVDDSKAIRVILGRILKELGFETFEAGDGREALDRLAEVGAIDLALVDWNMPEMNGLDFVRSVRADGYDDMTMIMVTTETETEQVVRALAAGANEYVMKPFSKDMLVEKLDLLGLTPA
ncbi:MAG TPA: response regulator [Actinomycetes bacterium]|nr:response regulator [Actinomycetes bacterium]